MTAIRIENLTKTFGTVRALDGLSLTVDDNSIFGFLGPNGAGKTTTIRLLTGLAHPTAGQAWVAELPIGKDHQAASKIGYLPEVPAFYPYFSPWNIWITSAACSTWRPGSGASVSTNCWN